MARGEAGRQGTRSGQGGRTRYTRAFDRRLLRLAVPERRALAGAIALGLVIAASRIGQGVAIAFGLAVVFSHHQWTAILPWVGLAVVLVVVRGIATAAQGATMAGASVRITTDLRIRLVSRILLLGPAWVARERSGELQAVMVDGVEKLDAYFRLFLAKVIVAGIASAAIIAIVIWIDPVAGSAVAAFALVVIFLPSVEYRALGAHMEFWSASYRPLAAEFVDNLHTALQRVSAGRTTLLIAHRPSTIRLADRIVVLDAGRVAETGTYDSLIAAGGTLARLLAKSPNEIV